jgi:two-component system, cell cycle sensor histidine kinase and response regulator CckA
MIFLDLMFNLTLLVSLSIISGFIENRWPRHTRSGVLLQGLLFGFAAVLGMLRPLVLETGLIIDGRSVMISLCALFFGPWAGIVTCFMTILCRIGLGGSGTLTGILVILSSTGIGLLARTRFDIESQPVSTKQLYLFGLVVHITMIFLLLTLPGGAGLTGVQRIALPVMLLYPLATILVGKILSDQILALHTMSELQEAKQNLVTTLQSIGDAVISTNLRGEVTFINPAAETLTGWSQNNAYGRPLDEVIPLVSEESGKTLENPAIKSLREGIVVNLSKHTLLITKDGRERPIADSAAPIRDISGEITGVVLVFHDQTEERRSQRLLQIRATLLEYAATHNIEEILIKTLDETGSLVNSPVGFYHFVESDQQSLTLQAWSTRTRKEFCHAEGMSGWHYSLDKAGVWADCARQKKPIIHNDYAALPLKQGLPPGHAEIVRELVVPVIQNDKVVAILGVGNNPANYTEQDMEIVRYLADLSWIIIKQKQAEIMLQESEAKYRNLIENAPIGIFSTSSQGQALSVNTFMSHILGFGSVQETLAHCIDLQKQLYVVPDDRHRFLQILQKNGHVENFEYQAHTAYDKDIWLSMNARIAQQKEDGSFIIDGFATDITAQRILADQFRQAQKMESVGRLAGGVAHDYNNMLSVILGHTELALTKVNPSDPVHEDLQEIFKAGTRSTAITQQLLAFARKQTIAPKMIDLNEAIEAMLKMLRRLIGEDTQLVWIPKAGLWPIKMDSSQLDQILANLSVNARDAITGIGKVTIETDMVTFDKIYCNSHPGFLQGDFVLLTVSDDGCGMDKETQSKLFEPFFTTKLMGQGTGLGLATVYGIVKQNDGFINVYSEPDKGTRFNIYIPRFKQSGPILFQEDALPDDIPSSQGESILIVEDELVILNMTKIMLEELGYFVLTASTIDEARQKIETHAGKINLLITDVIMPEINGRELAKQLIELSPDLKVLFMSGYTADVITHRGMLNDDVCFISKPFSMNDLATKVREALR